MSIIWTPSRRIWAPPSKQRGFICLPGGLGAARPGGGGASYEIQKSLRFRRNAIAYLNRTPGVAGNRRTLTFSAWVKLGQLSVDRCLFSAYDGSAGQQAEVAITASNTLHFYTGGNVGSRGDAYTSSVFRDVSSHYHVLISINTTLANGNDRIKIFVNGVGQSLTYTAVPPQNTDGQLNATINHRIGSQATGGKLFDGLISEIHFIDGQALDPSSFGEFDVNGVWVPKEYSGTYGTNGFYLPFSNGTSLSTLTADASGNGNNWTANNISLTAGVSYDWMDDTPTNNHATLNNLVAGAANITKANLASGTTAVRATFNALAIGSYWEVTAGGSSVTAGVINDAGTANTVTVTANKTFAFRLSVAGALDYRNVTDSGAWTSITTGLTGNQFPYGTTAAADWNFGQRPFSGTVPDGYAKLCAANLTNTTITTSGSFTGNASADGPVIFTDGVPTAMTINGNAVTFGTHADKLASGFKVRSSSASYNASGTNTYSITATGAAFKNARAQVNP